MRVTTPGSRHQRPSTQRKLVLEKKHLLHVETKSTKFFFIHCGFVVVVDQKRRNDKFTSFSSFQLKVQTVLAYGIAPLMHRMTTTLHDWKKEGSTNWIILFKW